MNIGGIIVIAEKLAADTQIGIRVNGKEVYEVTKRAKRGHKSVESRMVNW